MIWNKIINLLSREVFRYIPVLYKLKQLSIYNEVWWPPFFFPVIFMITMLPSSPPGRQVHWRSWRLLRRPWRHQPVMSSYNFNSFFLPDATRNLCRPRYSDLVMNFHFFHRTRCSWGVMHSQDVLKGKVLAFIEMAGLGGDSEGQRREIRYIWCQEDSWRSIADHFLTPV